ncbi:MAG: metallophosphoesterase [Paenibacillaceae bacterium]
MHNDKKEPRLLVISDIHGHTDGLDFLLREAGYRSSVDRLILLGDYIDSDPQTFSTLLTVKKLVDEGACAVPGNQETALMRAVDLRKHVMSIEVMEWLRGLPLYIEEDNYIFVHAGIRPGVPMLHQSAMDLTEIREEFWSETEKKLNHTVIFGHTPTFKLGAARGELWFGDNRIGIDTGAKHGCRLTLYNVYEEITYSCSTSSSNMYSDFRVEKMYGARKKEMT